MITIFNRESLWIGRDMKRFNEMREALEREKIPYTYRTRSSGNRWMGHGTVRGSFGEAVPDCFRNKPVVLRRMSPECMLYNIREGRPLPGASFSLEVKAVWTTGQRRSRQQHYRVRRKI